MLLVTKPTKIFFGFSLIEVMAAIVIISILGTITVPAMKKIIIQAKVTEMINSTEELKTRISFQINRLDSVTNSGQGMSLPSRLSNYVDSFTVSNDGIITINGNTSAAGVSLTFTPNLNSSEGIISWSCLVADSSQNEYVPETCQDNS